MQVDRASASRVDIFHAVADANRRKLLDLLAAGERPVQELVPHFDMSFQAVSQHLHILAEAGLVTRRKQGRYRIYRAQPAALRDIHDWAGQYRAFWENRLERLGDYLDES